MNQPALPGIAAPVPIADPSGAVYTPGWLAILLARYAFRDLLAWLPRDNKPRTITVLDSGVGGGALIRGAETAAAELRAKREKRIGKLHTVGCDLNPDAEGLALCSEAIVGDWRDVGMARRERAEPVMLCLSNPPFGEAVGMETTCGIVRESIRNAVFTYAILPVAYVSGQEFHELVAREHAPNRILRVPKRPWPDRLREAVVLGWTPHTAHRIDVLEPSGEVS